MEVVILGCGRVGARVANELLYRSHGVTVIDRNAAAFERLGPEFLGDTLVGNGIDIDVLRQAGVDRADVFLAVTELDDRNLMAGQIARQIGARRVVARVYDPVRSEIYGEMGIITFSPTVLSAERLFRLVTRDGEGG